MTRALELKGYHTRFVMELVKSIPTAQQPTNYLAALSDLTGELVTQMQYRVFRKYGGKAEGVDPQDWIAKCRKDMQKRPEFYFITVDTERDERQQMRWRRELWEAQRRILRLEQGGFPMRNSNHCTAFGGCAFIGLCAGDYGIDGLPRREEANPELSGAGGSIDPLTCSRVSRMLSCEEYGRLVDLEGLAEPVSLGRVVGSALHFGFEHMDPDAAEEHLREARKDDLAQELQERTEREAGMVRAIVEFGIPFWDEWPKFREVEFRLPLVNPETGATSLRFHRSGVIDGVWSDSLPPLKPSTDPRHHTDAGVYAYTVNPSEG